MNAGPSPSADDLLDGFIAAWHAGDTPALGAWVARAVPEERDELTELIGAFLQLAPTIEPTGDRADALAADPLVQRLAGLEGAWWEARAGDVAREDAAEAIEPWGERLRRLRGAAGLELAAVARSFSERFALGAADAERTEAVLGRLEAGGLPPEGVASRAARALEELLGAAAGSLTAGAAPAVGGALFRGADGDEQQFATLLADIDDALPQEAPGEGDALADLLGG